MEVELAENLPVITVSALLSLTLFSVENVNLFPLLSEKDKETNQQQANPQHGRKNDESKPNTEPNPRPNKEDINEGENHKIDSGTDHLSKYIMQEFKNASVYNKKIYIVGSITFGKNVSDLDIDRCTQAQSKSRDSCSDEVIDLKSHISKSIHKIWQEERKISRQYNIKGNLFTVKILGHSSEEGDTDTNNKISKERSDSVRKSIMTQIRNFGDKQFSNWAESRIDSIGNGSKFPKYVDKTGIYDEVMSRRVEILIEINEMP